MKIIIAGIMGMIVGLSVGLTIGGSKQSSESDTDRFIRLKTKCEVFEQAFYSNGVKMPEHVFNDYCNDKMEVAVLKDRLFLIPDPNHSTNQTVKLYGTNKSN